MSIDKVYNLGIKLFLICRSITGEGVRETLFLIKKYIPKLKIFEVPSGTKVFDWKIPPEWNVKNAYVLDKFGKKIIDFKKNNLHLVSYSVPVNKKIKKKEFFLISIRFQNNLLLFHTLHHITKNIGDFVFLIKKKKFLKKSIKAMTNLK